MVFAVTNTASPSQGTNYLKITSTAGGGDGGIDTYWNGSGTNWIVAGVTYTLSFDLQYVSGVNSVWVSASCYANGVWKDLVPSPTQFLTNEYTNVWRHYSFDFTPTNSGVFYVGFRPKVGGNIVTETFLLDNVILKPRHDVVGHVICGYQGWFNTPSDGASLGWGHWANGTPAPGNVHVAMWPDVRGHYAPLDTTGFGSLGNGAPAQLFSSHDQGTVNTHFYWMQRYGIDGVAVQCFAGNLPTNFPWTGNNQVQTNYLAAWTVKQSNIMTAAEDYGRTFYVTYDISGMGSNSTTWVATISNHWVNYFSNPGGFTSSPAYARQGTNPVVQLWGLGVQGNNTPSDGAAALQLVRWFQTNQHCYVVGGVVAVWRVFGDAGLTNWCWPNFMQVYTNLNMISPWTVGGGQSNATVDSVTMTNYTKPDFSYCNARGIAYQPVFFPGFDFSNADPSRLHNATPRNQGSFMWRWVYDFCRLGITNAYLAMFDEYDEGTAIAKAASDSSLIPTNQYFQTLSADGVFVSSDFYLRLAGAASTAIAAGVPLASTNVPIPLSVGPDWFRSGLEYDTTYPPDPTNDYTYDPYVTWNDTVDSGNSINIGPFAAPDTVPHCAKVLDQTAHVGRGSILCKGRATSTAHAYCYFKVFSVNIPVNSNTKLSYWSYPGNTLGRFVAVDLIMTDGTTLRDSGAVDQNGVSVHPAAGRGAVGQWSQTICNIGQWLNGKTIAKIDIAYDHSGATNEFLNWLDDIEISDGFPAGNYKLVNLESGKALWSRDYVDSGELQVWSYQTNQTQQWRIDDFDNNNVIYCSATNKAIWAVSTNNQAKTRIYTYVPGLSSQRWELVPADRYYKISSMWNGMFLTESATTNGAYIIQQTLNTNNTNSQTWSIQSP